MFQPLMQRAQVPGSQVQGIMLKLYKCLHFYNIADVLEMVQTVRSQKIDKKNMQLVHTRNLSYVLNEFKVKYNQLGKEIIKNHVLNEGYEASKTFFEKNKIRTIHQ